MVADGRYVVVLELYFFVEELEIVESKSSNELTQKDDPFLPLVLRFSQKKKNVRHHSRTF